MDRTAKLLALALLATLSAGAAALPAAAQAGYSVQSDATGRDGDHLFRIDLATGAATDLGPSGFQDVESLAFAPTCAVLYAVDDVSDRLLTCDKGTGACTAVGGLGTDVTDTGLAFGADGNLYMSTDAPKNPSRLYRLDRATGRATLIGTQGQEVTGLAGTLGNGRCPSGMYGLGGDGRNNLVCVNLATGQATPIGPLKNVQLNDGGLDFGSGGVLFGLADQTNQPTRVITVDPATGEATVVATVQVRGKDAGGFEGLAVDQGVCVVTVAKAPVIDAPALGPLGLAALALALAAAGLFALRRTVSF